MYLMHSDGGYEREKTVYFADDICDSCGKKVKCVVCDASDGEYRPVYLCQDCLNRGFEHEESVIYI